MKKFWITVSIIAVAAIGLWQFGNLIRYASHIPYLSELIRQPAGGNGGGQHAQPTRPRTADGIRRRAQTRRWRPDRRQTVAAVKRRCRWM